MIRITPTTPKVTDRPATPRRRAIAGLATLGLAAAATGARSQSAWPDRPVRFIVNAPPGGTADIAARIVGEGLSPSLGRPIVVESKAGGSGMIGVQELMRSPADGHTFLVSVNGAFTEVPHSVKFPGDPVKDIRPIADIYFGSLLLVGNASVPAKTLPELIAWVKSQPNGVSYASYSPGTLSHIHGLQLARNAGIELNHVGYRGSPPAMQDLLGGQVPLMFNSVANVLPNLKDGRLRAFAIASGSRSEFLPEVPTFAELGYPDLQATVWMGLWSMPQVPTAIQSRMQEEVRRLLGRPEVRKRFGELAFTPAQPRSPDELAQSIAADHERAGAILRSVGYKPGS